VHTQQYLRHVMLEFCFSVGSHEQNVVALLK
jgi:hypothetical protein